MASNAVAKFQGASLTRGASVNVAAGALVPLGAAKLQWNAGVIGKEPLGAGGFGVVLAYGLPNRQIVARKTFSDEEDQFAEGKILTMCSDKALEGRFVGADNVVKAVGNFGKFDHNGSPTSYIDYELAIMDLKHAKDHTSELFPTVEAVTSMVHDCIRGLDFLHVKVGVTHNDMKPHNILVFECAQLNRKLCKISDLGICTRIKLAGASGTERYHPRMGTDNYTHCAGVIQH